MKAIRRFLLLSPLLFVAFFYVGGVLGVVVQELLLTTSTEMNPLVSRIALAVFALPAFVAPAWGISRSVWLLSRNRSKVESLCALLLSLPFMLVVMGSIQRASAASLISQTSTEAALCISQSQGQQRDCKQSMASA
ncbi:hypothetical protein ACS5PN_16870 [Roseateles sp. NT4]|uniref:hypothetical protein n=1 Tax=Roseateles sp. NT4 TaxID=3453715 RepID=UPI003EE8D20D